MKNFNIWERQESSDIREIKFEELQLKVVHTITCRFN